MNIYIFPFLFLSILGILAFRVFMKKASTGFEEAIENFKEEEQKANYTVKNIKDLDFKYIHPNKDILPFKEYNEEDINLKIVIKKQNLAKRKLNFEMIKLPLGLTNTQIKSIYGINNFEKVTFLEEQYNAFIRAIFEWANALYDIGEEKDCKIILEEAARLEGDISQIYTILAEIYFKNNEKENLIKLRNNVISYDLSLKETILKFLDEKIFKL